MIRPGAVLASLLPVALVGGLLAVLTPLAALLVLAISVALLVALAAVTSAFLHRPAAGRDRLLRSY